MRKKSKLVYGVGVNDADYRVCIRETIGYGENGKKIKKVTWTCPFYSRWQGMLERCYSEREHLRKSNYIGCSVIPEWHYFMTFRAWMVEQDWEAKELDKDILFPGNKIYGPDTCVFVDLKVNSFLTERTKSRGEYPIGVSFYKRSGKYVSFCSDVITKKNRNLGYFKTPEEAHQTWLTFKLEQAKILASQQTDPRVADALIDRYENYEKYFGGVSSQELT